jgi:hypothetical protein
MWQTSRRFMNETFCYERSPFMCGDGHGRDYSAARLMKPLLSRPKVNAPADWQA